MLLGNLLQQLYNMVDSIISQKLGRQAGPCRGRREFPHHIPSARPVHGALHGINILIAQYQGAKDTELE